MSYIERYNKLKQEDLPNVVNSQRPIALERFSLDGLPDKKNEKYKYTDIKSLLEFGEYSPSLHQNKEQGIEIDTYTVYVGNDGIEIKGQVLESGLRIETLSKNHNDFIQENYNQLANKDNDPLSALNTLLAYEGVFIYVDANVTLNKPIYIKNQISGTGYRQLRNLFIFGENSEATILFHNMEEGIHINHCTETILAPSARVEYVRIQENMNSIHLATDYIRQEANSLFNYTNVLLDGKIIRNNIEVELTGEHCECHLYGVVCGRNTQHFDNYTSIDHSAPNCESNELFKSILSGQSINVFNGRILVRQDAQKTTALQANKNILLSDTVQVKSKPQLEIYADDVKCTHGATIGQLNQDELFYMQARGINKDSARLLLISGFLNEVVQKVKNQDIRDYLTNKLEKGIY